MSAFAFNLVRLNNTMLTGIRSPSFQPRETQMPSETDGTIYQTSSPVIRAAPMARFSTIAVRSLFSLFGSTRPPYVAMDGTNGLELIGAQIGTNVPGYASGTVHARRQGLNGLVALSGLSWRPRDVVEATVDAYWIAAAGGTNPVPPTTIALPTIPVNTEQLVLTGVSGIPATRITSLDLSITHQIENNDESICYNTGLPYPILTKQPGVGGTVEIIQTVETLDLTTTLSNGTVTSTFGVLNHNGLGLGASTAFFTLNNPQIREEEVAGKPATRRITIRGTWDGTNSPITLGVA